MDFDAKQNAIEIAPALEDFRQWVRDQEHDGDEPPPFWGTIHHPDYRHGIDVNIELDEETEVYTARIYPNYLDKAGYLATDTGVLLAAIPSTQWPQ